MMNELFYIETPIGTLQVTMQCGYVCTISLCRNLFTATKLNSHQQRVKREIEEYFAGKRREFTFPYKMEGTSFQQDVWRELCRVPFGEIATYGEIARRIGKPGAARAVGMACNRNPLLIAIPCHRIVGTNNKLTGFAVGIERKKFLLDLETV